MTNLQEFWKRSFLERKYRIRLHILFWLFYFTVFIFFTYYTISIADQGTGNIFQIILFSLIFNVPITCVSYYLTINTAYHALIDRNRYLNAILYLFGCIILFSQLLYLGALGCLELIKYWGIDLEHSGLMFEKSVQAYGYGIFSSLLAWLQIIISYFVLMGVPVTARFFRDQLRLQHGKNSLEKENLKLEMDFLKAQIHPHFLFNTLNNIYSLISHNETKKSAEMISGLSSLLRYALYEGKSEFISLEKEVGMLKDYMELEEVRTDNVNLEIRIPSQLPDLKIPPFLLLPLVENAFKHGVNSQLQQACLKIDLQITDVELELTVQNTFDADYRKKNSGGLGLLNLKKRLDYYYNNHYFLETVENKNIFTARLKLPLLCPLSNA